MKQLLALALISLAAPAIGAEHPVCPKLVGQPSVVWDSSLETFLTEKAWICHAKNQAGETVLSSFATVQPGNSTYGANFRAITAGHGHPIVWFSDRDANGNSENIARSYFSTGNSDFPVMMIWFKFNDHAEFNSKTALVSLLQVQD